MSKVFGNYLKVYFVFGKIWNYFGKYYAIEPIFIAVNGQIF